MRMSSNFIKRLFKYFDTPCMYNVEIEIRIGKKFLFIEKEVIAKSRKEAVKIANQMTSDSIKVITGKAINLGKLKQLNEIK
jgi:hypothetical protein